MEYKCDFAFRDKDDYIICKKTEQECGNVKFCRQANRWKLNELSAGCRLKQEEIPAEKPVKVVKKRGAKNAK